MTERMTGTDRTGDPLLSLDEACIALRQLLISSQWYSTYLFGMPGAPIGERWHRRYREPRPGELCFVTDHAINPRADDDTIVKSFGYFLGEQQEPIYDWDTWVMVQDQYDDMVECPTERVFYIQYGPAPDDVCRWANADHQVIATQAISDELHNRC
ncbi:MAG TPA: hypothetical protein VFI12_04675 [Thermomicrobiales bacterium]|nr:hypothetical protein [Thermomicrobiales bacterium]